MRVRFVLDFKTFRIRTPDLQISNVVETSQQMNWILVTKISCILQEVKCEHFPPNCPGFDSRRRLVSGRRFEKDNEVQSNKIAHILGSMPN